MVSHADLVYNDVRTLRSFPVLLTPSKKCTLVAPVSLATFVTPHLMSCILLMLGHALQGTFLPANVSKQLDDMTSHTTLVAAAAKVKHHYDKLRTWRSSLLKESSQDLAGAVAANDIGTEIENVLKR